MLAARRFELDGFSSLDGVPPNEDTDFCGKLQDREEGHGILDLSHGITLATSSDVDIDLHRSMSVIE